MDAGYCREQERGLVTTAPHQSEAPCPCSLKNRLHPPRGRHIPLPYQGGDQAQQTQATWPVLGGTPNHQDHGCPHTPTLQLPQPWGTTELLGGEAQARWS